MRNLHLQDRPLKTITSTFLALVLLSPIAANAIPTQYEDRAQWEAANGTVTFTEDFESFDVETSFFNTAVALNQMTLEASGTRSFQKIMISDSDTNVNGSIQLRGITKFGDTTISLLFDNPVSAWGADFADHNGVENLLIDVLDLSGALLMTLDATTNRGFLGFVAGPGEQVGSLTFRSGVEVLNYQEAFGMDNVAGVAISVPEPGTLALFGIGLFGMGLARRNKI